MKYKLNLIIALFLLIASNIRSQNTGQIQQDLEQLWPNMKAGYTARINKIKTDSTTQVLDDLREQTNNFLLYAHNTSNYQLIDELAELYLHTYDELSTFAGNKKQFRLYSYSELEYDDISYYHQYWLDKSSSSDGFEHKNHSPAFLYLLSQLMNISTKIPDNEYDNLSNLKELNQKLYPVLKSIYYRWLVYDKSFQQQRSKTLCNLEPSNIVRFNFIDFLQKKLDNSLGYNYNSYPSGPVNFCNNLSNNELYIISGMAEILGGQYNNPQRFSMSEPIKSKFITAFKLGNMLIKKNLFEVNTIRENRKGLILNAGALIHHQDYEYAGNDIDTINDDHCDESLFMPKKSDSVNIGRDISHSRSLYPILESIKNNNYLIDEQFPNEQDILKVSNQFLYTVFNGNQNEPLFSNFYDGSNGWYRVNYGNHPERPDKTVYPKKGNGTRPYDLSSEAITAGYFFWKKYDSQHAVLRNSLYNNVTQKIGTSNTPDFINNHYFASYETEDLGDICNSYRVDFSNSRISVARFQFYPTFFDDNREQIDDNNCNLIIATVNNTYPHIYNSNFANTIGQEVYQSTFNNNENNTRNYGEIIDITSGGYGNGEEILTAFYSTQQGVLVYKNSNDKSPATGQIVYPLNTSFSDIKMESIDLDQNGSDELISAFRTKTNKTVIYRSHGGYPGSGQIIYPLNSYWEVIDMVSGNYEGENVLLTVFKHDDIFVITQSVKNQFENGNVNGFFGKEIYRETLPDYRSINLEIGDYNGDGKDELISAFIKKDDHIVNNETILIFKNNEFKPGEGEKLPFYKFFTDIKMTTGDFDGDSKEELISAFYNPSNGGSTSIYKSQGVPGTGIQLYNENPMKVNTMAVFNKSKLKSTSSFIQDKNTPEKNIKQASLIFPNPNQGIFHIKSKNMNVEKILVYNILGQKVSVKIKGSAQKTIELKNKDKGFYIIKYFSNGESFSKSFVVE